MNLGQRNKVSVTGNMSSMTDLVFLLLIFFMLAGRLVTPEPFDIDPPASQSETNARADGLEIQLAADGRLALDGETIALDALVEAVEPLGVAVVVECRHFCMVMRGVQKTAARTVTSSVRGCFESNPKTRAEFFSLINSPSNGLM